MVVVAAACVRACGRGQQGKKGLYFQTFTFKPQSREEPEDLVVCLVASLAG